MSYRKLYTFLFVLFFMAYSFLSLYPNILVLVALVVALLFLFLFYRLPRITFNENYFAILVPCFLLLILFLIGLVFWRSRQNTIALLLPMFVALSFLFVDLVFLKKIIVFCLVAVVILAAAESFTGSYLYYSTVEFSDGSTANLDEELFSGLSDIFRAKSIFLGPLTMSAFMIGVAIIFRRNSLLLLVALCGGIFAVSRASMFFITFLILFNLLSNLYGSPKKIALYFIVFFGLLGYIVVYADNILARIVDGFQFGGESTTNSARLYFWFSGASEFLEYDFLNTIFGDAGRFWRSYNNNAESGWLTILLDFGVLGFFVYISPLLYLLLWSRRFDTVFVIFSMFFINSMFTFSYGVVGGFVYWVIVVILFIEESERKKRSGKNFCASGSDRLASGSCCIS